MVTRWEAQVARRAGKDAQELMRLKEDLFNQTEALASSIDAVNRAYDSMVYAYHYWLEYTTDLDLRESRRTSYHNAKGHWEALSVEMVIQQKRYDRILREIEALT